MECISAVFSITVNVDHVPIVHQSWVNDPVPVLQRNIREGTALGCHGAIYAGPIITEADRCGNHRFRLRVVLIPEGDSARAVPPMSMAPQMSHQAPSRSLVIARAAGHDPPAVPVAVPPVQQYISGPSILTCTASRRFPAECGRIDGDLTGFVAECLPQRSPRPCWWYPPAQRRCGVQGFHPARHPLIDCRSPCRRSRCSQRRWR